MLHYVTNLGIQIYLHHNLFYFIVPNVCKLSPWSVTGTYSEQKLTFYCDDFELNFPHVPLLKVDFGTDGKN